MSFGLLTGFGKLYSKEVDEKVVPHTTAVNYWVSILYSPQLQRNHFFGMYACRKHEWCKHGTCAVAAQLPGISNLTSYFSQALSLFERHNVTETLTKHGITPSSNTTYSVILCTMNLYCCSCSQLYTWLFFMTTLDFNRHA